MYYCKLILALIILPRFDCKSIGLSSSDEIGAGVIIPVWILVSIVAMLAVGLLINCTCGPCKSRGTVNPAQYMGHTHETKQALHDARKSGANAEAANLFWEKIWKIGGRTIGVKAALNSPQEMMRLGITEQDIALFGGRERIYAAMMEMEERMASVTSGSNESAPPTPRPLLAPPLPPIPGYQIPQREQFKPSGSTTSVASNVNRPLPPTPQELKRPMGNPPRPNPNVINPRAQGLGRSDALDKQADFDEYTIYDQGELNEYGLMKDSMKKKMEGGAGLDVKGDFDEYTIYDQGPMNEYGLMKDVKRKKEEGGAGLDVKGDFDEYTIYDSGPMNEYGLMKDMMRKKQEGGAGLDVTGDFDEYTIYDSGPMNEYGILKAERERKMEGGTAMMPNMNRPLPAVPEAWPARPLPAIPTAKAPPIPTAKAPPTGRTGLDIGADFDEYTIYDQGQLNEYGLMKDSMKKKTEGGAGLDVKGDFDEYTIYDQGPMNEYGLMKDVKRKKEEGGAGLDVKGDFDEYTIYDSGPMNEYGLMKDMMRKKEEGGAGLDVKGDFDDYTIYDTGPMNEYGVLKAERERKREGGAMTAGGAKSGRQKQKVKTKVRKRTGKKIDDGAEGSVCEGSVCDDMGSNYTQAEKNMDAELEGQPSNYDGKMEEKKKERKMEGGTAMTPNMNRPLPTVPEAWAARPLPATPTATAPPTGRTGGLDVGADFNEYTIYDQGQLNEYGLMKDSMKKKTEGGAGLDVKGDFDEYTIYDQGPMNEYGLMKDVKRKKEEGGAGLDVKGDFDEYTIYDSGPMNEYGLMKDMMRKKEEGGAGLDVKGDFDDYTIYDTGPMNEYGMLKTERERKMEGGAMTAVGAKSGRRKQRVKVKTRVRKRGKKMVDGAEGSVCEGRVCEDTINDMGYDYTQAEKDMDAELEG